MPEVLGFFGPGRRARRARTEARGKSRLCIRPGAVILAGMADTPEPPRPPLTFKPKEFERVNPAPSGGPPPPANDIFAIQREIRAREIASGMDELKPVGTPRRSRRRRDYWFMLVAGNLAFVLLAGLGSLNVVALVYAFSGIILYSVGLTWVMWFVMSDY